MSATPEPSCHAAMCSAPHRLRDTFAVGLLLAGVPIERVSVLLGHQSVRVKERHYNLGAFTAGTTESGVASASKRDPILNQDEGTNSVHLAKGPVN